MTRRSVCSRVARPAPAAVVCAVAAAALLAGCIEERIVRDDWAAFQREFGDPKSAAADGDARDADGRRRAPEGWAVFVTSKTGPHRYREAFDLVRELTAREGLAGLWVHDVAGEAIVFCGKFRDRFGDEAKATLARVRAIEPPEDASADDADAGDEQAVALNPYADAELIPIYGTAEGVGDAHDLAAYSGYFSLQIAFYDRAYDGNRREAAEEAVDTLRKDGHEAYFYHGPHRSMVTIGLFTYDDFTQRGNVEVYGPKVRALQETFPYNLGNGLTVEQKLGGEDIGAQESFLIRVP